MVLALGGFSGAHRLWGNWNRVMGEIKTYLQLLPDDQNDARVCYSATQSRPISLPETGLERWSANGSAFSPWWSRRCHWPSRHPEAITAGAQPGRLDAAQNDRRDRIDFVDLAVQQLPQALRGM